MASWWEAGGFLPRLPDSLEQLDLLPVWVAKPRKIHPDGVHFQGLRYLNPTLAAYVGELVTIRYDPRDLAELRVFYRDRFLCRVICPREASRKASSKASKTTSHEIRYTSRSRQARNAGELC